MGKANDIDMERFFLALSDKTRLRILNLIGDDEICVCFFVTVLDELQPKISRHLGVLRETGLVSARKDGKWMHYRVEVPGNAQAARVFADVRAWLKEDREMQRDRAKLVRVCCSPGLPAALDGAPLPSSALTRISHRKPCSD